MGLKATRAKEKGERHRLTGEGPGYLEDECVGGGRKDRLAGLHDLPEGDGSGAQGQDGEGVGQRRPHAHWGQLLPVITSQSRSLAESDQPNQQKSSNNSILNFERFLSVVLPLGKDEDHTDQQLQ